MTRTLRSGDAADMWVRAMLCCERVDGVWRIVHDHESVSLDPQTGADRIAEAERLAAARSTPNVIDLAPSSDPP